MPCCEAVFVIHTCCLLINYDCLELTGSVSPLRVDNDHMLAPQRMHFTASTKLHMLVIVDCKAYFDDKTAGSRSKCMQS